MFSINVGTCLKTLKKKKSNSHSNIIDNDIVVLKNVRNQIYIKKSILIFLFY